MTWLGLLGEVLVQKKSPEKLKRFRAAHRDEMAHVSKWARFQARVEKARAKGDWAKVGNLESQGKALHRACTASRGRTAPAESSLNGRLREVLGVE